MYSVTNNDIFTLAIKADHSGQRNLADRLYAIGACMSEDSTGDIDSCSKCYQCRDCKGDASLGRKIAGKSILGEF